VLRERGVVPLDELLQSRRGIAITFDDGYADNAGAAREILATTGLPATFFIASGLRRSTSEAWWDRLEQLLLGSETGRAFLEVKIENRPVYVDIRSAAGRERAHAALFWRVRRLPQADIDVVIASVEEQLGVRTSPRSTHRWMSDTELLQLADSPGVDVGGHTVTHPFLAALSEPEQRRELEGCRADLEALLGRPVRRLSYPYGGPDAFDSRTCRLAREAGYVSACTVTGGPVAPGTDPFQIPRNTVSDCSGAEFEAWLERLDSA
jgi:peptidoglycan/xylan/chitin deacetylase (PgdA/CDA1 family)